MKRVAIIVQVLVAGAAILGGGLPLLGCGAERVPALAESDRAGPGSSLGEAPVHGVPNVSNTMNTAPPQRADGPSALSEAEVVARVRGYASAWGSGLGDALVQTEPDRAPFDCRAPAWHVEPSPSEAKTGDEGHGHKLYYLYAKDVHAYRSQSGLVLDVVGFEVVPPGPPVTAQPVGQIIVKEAWTDVAVGEGELVPPRPVALPGRAQDRTWIDGKTHRVGAKAALFAMLKVADHEVPGSDAGWVYATLTPDGDTVTSVGALPACMRCHTKAPSDRIFGVKRR